MNIFEICPNVTVGVSIIHFCPTMVKFSQKMLSKQRDRFCFIFTLTSHYQNHEFISVSSECGKSLREVFNFSHKNYFNNCKECLIRCHVKNFENFTFI